MRALIVDDDEFSLELLQDVLNQLGHEVERASNGQEALATLRKGEIHLVITDWEMPAMNGLELCRAIRQEDFDGYVFVIMLTSREGGRQRIEGLHAGADAFLIKPLNPDELLVSLKTAERILGLETRDLAMFALAKLSESRDPETGAHIERVQSYARVLAQYLSTTEQYCDQIDPEFVRLIFQTSPLHDIGKVGIPDNVLLKPGKLDDQEMAIMRTHATMGAQTLEASLQRFPNVRFLQMARDIAAGHHERWDGKGYPRGLAGEQIPLAARIVALADVYDAVTSRRVYRDAMSHAQAKAMVLRERGAHFDPNVVDAFVRTEQQFIAIKERFKDVELEDGDRPAEAAGAPGAPGAPPRPAAAPAAPAREVARPSAEGSDTIMVVDDDPGVRDLLTNFIHSLGLACVACADAETAMRLFPEHDPRIVISDWEMPDVDGLELCRRVRAKSGHRHVHFVMLTVHAGREQLCRAFDAGVDDFISKPFGECELMARLRAAMRAVALHDELSRQNQGSQRLNEQLTSLNQRLEKLAITDDLTGLCNRRQAVQRLEEQWSLSDRYQRPVAVVVVDIDHFKQINDTYGHAVGDQVLRGVADVLRGCVRASDVPCRIGGEEFLVILPAQTLQEAEVCAERCRLAVAARTFEYGGHGVRVTVSAGVASRRPGAPQCADLLAEADEALYAAKRAGRNTVRAGRSSSGTGPAPAATPAA